MWLLYCDVSFLNVKSALSRWCITHRKKAKEIVETWDKQFNSSQKEQRVSFLYLANDILQNSRRKGSEFVNEFWKFLPAALRHVYENGDEYGKKAVTRLVSPILSCQKFCHLILFHGLDTCYSNSKFLHAMLLCVTSIICRLLAWLISGWRLHGWTFCHFIDMWTSHWTGMDGKNDEILSWVPISQFSLHYSVLFFLKKFLLLHFEILFTGYISSSLLKVLILLVLGIFWLEIFWLYVLLNMMIIIFLIMFIY